jgi:hypothetical protein
MADEATKLTPITNPNRPVKRIDPDLLARSALPRRSPLSPFVPPSFPPGVERAVREAGLPTIAMDQFANANFGWAGTDTIYNAYAEGVVFLGYSYLATLAQRAEYRVVTETIASEMTREWIELKIQSDDESKGAIKKQIEDEMDRLDLRHAFRKVAESDGFFGRGHLYLDTGCTDDADELLTDLGDGKSIMSQLKIGPNKSQKLIAVRAVEATWCYPTHYESVDPLKRDWYAPITWYVMSREVHRSRLITFIGREVPDILKPAYAFGGLSMSQMLKPYVDNWLRTRQAVGDMVLNFSHNILKTNMDATTGIGGDQLLQRIALFNNIKNNQGTMVLDRDSEDFANISAPVGSLDRLQAQAQEHMACLSYENTVVTDRGLVRICDVRVTDKVMTRTGWAPLSWSGCTGRATKLIEIKTANATLRCTPNHPIYLPSINGFVSADSVCVGDCLLGQSDTATVTALPLHGGGIGGGRARMAGTATLRRADYYIASFGKLMSALSQMATKSTTSTATTPIINCPIWNYGPAPLTMPSILKMAGAGVPTAIPLFGAQNASSAAPSLKPIRKAASIAANGVMLPRIAVAMALCQRMQAMLRSARNAVRNLPSPSPQSDGSIAAPNVPAGSTTVVSVNVIEADEPVYNLEVAPGHLPEFYANGVLVHNSISRIPLVKLLGIQPAGLNASSEGELIAFEDWIAAFQETLFRRPLTVILDLIQLSLFGKIDDDITFDFNPLRQLNPTDQAQLEATIAQTREAYLQGGAVDAEEVREALANDPDTPFDGVDLNKPLPQPPGVPGLPGMPGAPPGGSGGGGAPGGGLPKLPGAGGGGTSSGGHGGAGSSASGLPPTPKDSVDDDDGHKWVRFKESRKRITRPTE